MNAKVDKQRYLRRCFSKPEQVHHTDLLVGGILFRVPSEFVVISQRSRKAVDPSSILGPSMLSRKSRACSASSVYDHMPLNTHPSTSATGLDTKSELSSSITLPSIQELRDFSSSLSTIICPNCNNLTCSCGFMSIDQPPPL